MNKKKRVSEDLFYNDLGHAMRLVRQVVGKAKSTLPSTSM